MMVMITFDPCEFFSTFSTSAHASLPALLVQRLAPDYEHNDDYHHHHHDGNDDDDGDDDEDEKGGFTSLFPLAQRGQQVSAARS